MFMYKLNLLNLNENNWHGSKICLKKNLKSPQWLRNLKFKKYPFWRIDKQKNLQIINDGDLAFCISQDVKNISKKLSFDTVEFNKDIVSEKNIELRINQGEDVLGRGYKIKKLK